MKKKPKRSTSDGKIPEIKKIDLTQSLQHDFLSVDADEGLSDVQVETSRKKYGKNVLEEKKPPGSFVRFLKQLIEPLNILLIISAIISLILAILETIQTNNDRTEIITMYVDVVVMFLIVLGNALFSVFQEGKTLRNLAALKNMTSPVTKVLRNGDIQVIKSSDVVVGDILVLEAGDKVVADAVILEDAILEVDESILTGESISVKKDAEAVVDDQAPIGDHKNKIFSGTSIISGTVKAQVYAVGMNTQMGNIAKLLSEEEEQLSPLQRQIQKLSKILGIVVLLICIISFFVYIVVLSKGGFDIQSFWNSSLNNSIALAIAAIPEGLIALVTVVLSRSVKYMSTKNALVKKMPSVEVLGSASVICSDKTGTLTQNKMTVVKVWDSENNGDLQDPSEKNLKLLKYGSLCTNGDVTVLEDGTIQHVGDPTETAIVRSLFDLNVTKDDLDLEFDRIEEIPFDSDRKLMSVILKPLKLSDPNYENKYLVVTKGAIDSLLSISNNTDVTILEKAEKFTDEMSNKALRVLAVSYKWIDNLPDEFTSESIENNLTFLGLLGIIDPIRPEAKIAIEQCKKAGIRPIMITGDHKNTASAIAHELGILNEGQKAINGAELDKLSDEQLKQQISDFSVYARVSPEDKIRIVKAWQANDSVVGMTGDGVNDAPSLKAADIGCAMGITGTDVSKDAADMILMDDNFATIVEAVQEGRHVLNNIKKIILLLLTTNLSCIMTIFFGMLTFGINILSSLQILWINVVSETLPGIALGVNKGHERVMLDKPRHKNANIIDKKMFIKIVCFSIFITAISLIAFYIGLGVAFQQTTTISVLANYMHLAIQEIHMNAFNITWIWHNISAHVSGGLTGKFVFADQIRAASSFAFLTIGLCLSSNAISFRTNTSVFLEAFKYQKWVFLSFFVSALLLVLCSYTPGMNVVFNMNPIDMYQNKEWINFIPYAFAFSLFVVHEIVKLFDKSSFKISPQKAAIINEITSNN